MSLIIFSILLTHQVPNILIPKIGIIFTVTINTGKFQRPFSSRTQLSEFLEPRSQLTHQTFIGATFLYFGRSFLYLIEFCPKSLSLRFIPITDSESLGFPRFIAAITGLRIARMNSECPVGLPCFRHQFAESSLPIIDRIISRYIPSIIGNPV